jgi:hypothetical protein
MVDFYAALAACALTATVSWLIAYFDTRRLWRENDRLRRQVQFLKDVSAGLSETIGGLTRESDTLRGIINGMSERIAQKSELLTRRASRRDEILSEEELAVSNMVWEGGGPGHE